MKSGISLSKEGGVRKTPRGRGTILLRWAGSVSLLNARRELAQHSLRYGTVWFGHVLRPEDSFSLSDRGRCQRIVRQIPSEYHSRVVASMEAGGWIGSMTFWRLYNHMLPRAQ